MKTKKFLFILNLGAAVAFTLIFWNEKMGVNTAIFSLLCSAIVFALFPYATKNLYGKVLFAAQLFALIMVILNNTLLSKVMFSITTLSFVIFAQYLHQSIIFAGGSTIANVVYYVPSFFNSLSASFKSGLQPGRFLRRTRFLLVPAVLFLIFYFIYAAGNVVLADLSDKIGVMLEKWYAQLSIYFEPDVFGFFLVGLLITGIIIFRSGTDYFSSLDMRMRNNLSRKKDAFRRWQNGPFSDFAQVLLGKSSTGIFALKVEYRIGLVSLWLLNLLILFTNLLDLRYVWAGVSYTKSTEFSKYVHEGAGLLITSIILAIAILLFFFRGNLNFYSNNKWLKYGAYLWIIQNAFLTISVFQRNYHYIDTQGLAYKRVALIFFLVLVMGGLVTTFVKIARRHTTFFLFKTNSWILFFLLLAASLVDWDYTIANYNLTRANKIPTDAQFILSVSDTVLPLLEEHHDVLLTDRHTFFYSEDLSYSGKALEFLHLREKKFLEKQALYSWLSWNCRDQLTKRKLENFHILSLNKSSQP